jgi:hypothetical protein
MARAKGGSGEVSQMHMVRTALEDLGADAKPQALQDHIKEKFKKELPKSIISNYKSNLKKKADGGGSGGGGRGRKIGGGSLRVEHFEQVRTLVSQLGAEQVKRLIDVVG